MAPALKALLFDLDGTLVYTDDLHHQAWQEILRGRALPSITRTFFQQYISGKQNQDIVRALLPELSEAESTALIDAKEARFRTLARGITPLPGARKMLQWARRQQLRTGLVTNAPRQNTDLLLSRLGLAEAFDVTVLAEEAPAGKPDPAPYRLALSKLGLTPSEVLAFEDSPAGIRAARNAGLTVVAIASTHPPKALAAEGAALVVRDFLAPELPPFLTTLSCLSA